MQTKNVFLQHIFSLITCDSLFDRDNRNNVPNDRKICLYFIFFKCAYILNISLPTTQCIYMYAVCGYTQILEHP